MPRRSDDTRLQLPKAYCFNVYSILNSCIRLAPQASSVTYETGYDASGVKCVNSFSVEEGKVDIRLRPYQEPSLGEYMHIYLKSRTVCTSSRRSLALSIMALRGEKTGEFLGGHGTKPRGGEGGTLLEKEGFIWSAWIVGWPVIPSQVSLISLLLSLSQHSLCFLTKVKVAPTECCTDTQGKLQVVQTLGTQKNNETMLVDLNQCLPPPV